MASKKRLRLEDVAKSEDWQGFYDELKEETDRGCAFVGAAMLDEHLRQLLGAFFVDDSEEVGHLLDNADAPLGSFSSRIRTAYCLGLISEEVKNDLNIIREIRNSFAHRLHGLDFDSESIRAYCGNLKSCVELMDDMQMSPRGNFEFTVIMMANWIRLHALGVDAKREKRVKRPHWKLLETVRVGFPHPSQ